MIRSERRIAGETDARTSQREQEHSVRSVVWLVKWLVLVQYYTIYTQTVQHLSRLKVALVEC